MKWWILFLIILLAVNVSAIEVEINPFNTDYFLGENAVAEVIINEQSVEDFTSSKISLVDSNGQSLSSGVIVKQVRDRYIVYTKLPDTLAEGDYHFQVKLKYQEGYLKEKYFYSGNISVISSSNVLSVVPYIDLTQSPENIDLTVSSYKGDFNVHIYTPSFMQPQREDLFLLEMSPLRYFIDIVNTPVDSEVSFQYGDKEYIIPVIGPEIIINETENITNGTEEEPVVPLADRIINIDFLDNSEINVNITQDKFLQGDLKFKNTGNVEIKNVQFRLTDNLNEIIILSKYTFPIVGPEETQNITIYVNELKNAQIQYYSGNLTMTYYETIKYFPIKIYVKESPEEISEIIFEETLETNQTSSDDETSDLLNYSDLFGGGNQQEQKVMDVGIIVFVLLILLVIGVIYFFYLLRKKTIKKTSFKEILKTKK